MLFLRVYALDKAANKDFYEWTDAFYDNLIEESGTGFALKYDQYVFGELDSVACGKPLLDLLALEKEENQAYNEKYIAVTEFIYEQLKNQTTFEECGGNFIHKMNNKNRKKRWKSGTKRPKDFIGQLLNCRQY